MCASGVIHWRINLVMYNGDIPALKQTDIWIFLETIEGARKTSRLKYGIISGD